MLKFFSWVSQPDKDDHIVRLYHVFILAPKKLDRLLYKSSIKENAFLYNFKGTITQKGV